jgi:hypothetical protein
MDKCVNDKGKLTRGVGIMKRLFLLIAATLFLPGLARTKKLYPLVCAVGCSTPTFSH